MLTGKEAQTSKPQVFAAGLFQKERSMVSLKLSCMYLKCRVVVMGGNLHLLAHPLTTTMPMTARAGCDPGVSTSIQSLAAF